MANSKQFRNLTEYHNGTTAEDNIKLLDIAPFQHEDVSTNTNKLGRMNFAQSLCEPVAICSSNDPSGGAYTATCVNYPDFAVTYNDSQGNSHYLYGLKVRVIFTYGITYGSVASGTYPTLSINGSSALPLLAQGKAMASGSVVAGQSVEFTIIPYGNTIAFDADSNVRESTSSYIRYSDGSEFAKKGVIVASNTTITNAPPLDTNDVIRVYFDTNISGSNTSTAMSLSYNGTSYNVKVGKNGSLANFVASEISSGTYRYVQAYTTLELLFDGTQFVIVGNPVVCSSADYTIYADGYHTTNSVNNGNMSAVTSNAVSSELSSTMRAIDTYFTRFFTANTTVHIKDFVNKVVEVLGRGYKYITFGWSNGNQGYITDGNTSILMNGNFIMGYFRPINDSVTFVYSHFIVCDINGNKVFHVWIRRDSIEITEGIDSLN